MAVILAVVFILLIGFIVAKALTREQKQVAREYPVISKEYPSELLLLPSEISDSVFKKIEAEWEREHPDPIEEVKQKLVQANMKIMTLETDLEKYKKLLHIFKNGARPSFYAGGMVTNLDAEMLETDYQKVRADYQRVRKEIGW